MKEKDILYLIFFKKILVSRANYSSFAATMVFQPYLDEFKSFVPPFVLDFISELKARRLVQEISEEKLFTKSQQIVRQKPAIET